MANTLTGLIPTFYEALDRVSREMVGLIPAVSRNSTVERVALGQPVVVPITPVSTVIDNTPSNVVPSGGDQTITNVSMTITKSKSVQVTWNGEQQLAMNNAGSYDGIFMNQVTQGFRTLANMIEADLATAAYQGASRAYGTAGTAPFASATDFNDTAQLRKILDDNGAPPDDLHLILDSAATAKLRGVQTMLLKANEAGTDAFRRTGAISEVPVNGFMLHNSAALKPITKGTGASYVANGAHAVGATTIVLKTGTGTVLAGDVVTFTGDTNKYVVTSGTTAAGPITIGSPGLRNTLADGVAMTIGATYTPNVAFHRSAIQLATRAPARPIGPNGENKDLATGLVMVTDPFTGITFEIAEYAGFHQVSYMIGLAWGVAAIKPDHTATLVG